MGRRMFDVSTGRLERSQSKMDWKPLAAASVKTCLATVTFDGAFSRFAELVPKAAYASKMMRFAG